MSNFKYFTLVCLFFNSILFTGLFAMKPLSTKSVHLGTKLVQAKDSDTVKVNENNCTILPATVLTDVLGAAYNSRYMSIDDPNFKDQAQGDHTAKRNSEPLQPFDVDDTYSSAISDKPAWEVKHTKDNFLTRHMRSIDDADNATSGESHIRLKRHTHRRGRKNQFDHPWECESKIKWVDLGPNYFPRYLRTVECTQQKCWYGHYVCKPRSFTVKLLRRRNGECVETNELYRVSNDNLPEGVLKELWMWEERAVNFCCECAAE